MENTKKQPNYVDWTNRAKQGLSLLKTPRQRAGMNGMCKDDIDNWAHDEYVRHFGEPCFKD